MMESKQVTVGICFAMLSIGVDAQISYKEDRVLYCMDKLATGFSKRSGEYQIARFEPQRFSMKISNERHTANSYVTATLTRDDDVFTCVGFETEGHFPVVCKDEYSMSLDSFSIDWKTLRYTRTEVSTGGYSSQYGGDTDVIYGGACDDF